MGDFSATEKDRLEILWRLRGTGDGSGVPGEDGQDGADGVDGVNGQNGADGDGLAIYVENDVEVAAALVTLSRRSNGGNMYMADGNYFEGITVYSDNVNIIGSGGAVISPRPGQDGVLFHKVTGGSVKNLTIADVTNVGSAESAGVLVRGGSGVTVKDNTILRSDDAGISVQYDKYAFYALSIADRKDLDLTYDIDGKNHIVTGNYIEGTKEGCGIEIARCNDTIVTGNQIVDLVQHGIRVLGVHGCVIADNVIIDAAGGSFWGGISLQSFGDPPAIGGISKYTTNTVVDGNRCKCPNPLTMFNGSNTVVISNNVFECTTGTSGNCLTTYYIDGHSSPFTYDMKNIQIHDNLFINGRYSISLIGDIEDISIRGNRFVDFDYIGVACDTNYPDATYAESTDLKDVFINGNTFKPIDDATQDPKHGIYAITASWSSTTVHEFGNDHIPAAGYTYNETTEYTGGVINHTFYNDAPSDGNDYGRKNGAWAIVSSGGGGGSLPSVEIDCGTILAGTSDIDAGSIA